MRLSKDFFYTLREDAKDEDSESGNLLVKSGMIKKISNGIYMNMPLGERVSQKVISIVREEMNKAGASEVSMPHMLPMDYFEASGRAFLRGDICFKSSIFAGKTGQRPANKIGTAQQGKWPSCNIIYKRTDAIRPL